MRKVALIAVVAATASLTYAADADSTAIAASAVDPACHAATPLDTTCASRALDANGDGVVSPAEAAAFASSAASAPDWAPLRPPQHTGLDFKDAATEPQPPAPAPASRNGAPPLILALLALAALVVLLRRKPR